MLLQGHDFLGLLLELQHNAYLGVYNPYEVMSIWVTAGYVVADWVDLPFDSRWAV